MMPIKDNAFLSSFFFLTLLKSSNLILIWFGNLFQNWPNELSCLPMVRETVVQSHVKSYQRIFKKMVLDASLLNTQYYKGKNQG